MISATGAVSIPFAFLSVDQNLSLPATGDGGFSCLFHSAIPNEYGLGMLG